MKGFTNLLLVTISSCFHQQQVVVPHLFRDVYLEKKFAFTVSCNDRFSP